MDIVNGQECKSKTQILYRCCSIYALSKTILDNGLRIYGENKTEISLSILATIDILKRIKDIQNLY